MSFAAVINSPIGKLGLEICGEQLVGIQFLPDTADLKPAASGIAKETSDQLAQYFSKQRHKFDLPLKAQGTVHQKSVWQELDAISLGETKTYGNIAIHLKSGPRAIGNACRRNPLPIVVPCHRVVAKTHLGGFSGARLGRWLEIKAWLLDHEKAMCLTSTTS